MANPSFAIPAHPYPYEDFLGLVNSMPDSDPFSGVKGRLLEISKGDWNLASTKMGFVDWVIKGTEKKIAPTRALIHALEILLGDVTVKLPKHLNNVRSTLTAIEEFLKGPFYVELLRLTTLSSYTGLRCLHSSLAALTHRSWQQLGYEGLKHYVGRLEKLFKGRTTIASKGEDEDHINKIEDFVFDFRKYCAEQLGTIWKRLWNLHAAPFERLWKYDAAKIEAEERWAARSHSLSRPRFRPLSRASLSSTTYGKTAL